MPENKAHQYLATNKFRELARSWLVGTNGGASKVKLNQKVSRLDFQSYLDDLIAEDQNRTNCLHWKFLLLDPMVQWSVVWKSCFKGSHPGQ